MTTVIFEGRDPKPHSFSVGMQGEHNAETITLEGLPEYGTPVLNVILPDGTGDVLNITDGHVTLTRNHTPEGGTLTAWITEVNGNDLVWKSEKFYMSVGTLPEIEGPVEQRYPDFVEQAINDVTSLVADAVAAKDAVFGMSAQAETLPTGSPATASYSQGVLTIGVPNGSTPQFSIGSVQNGETASATITGTIANPILNLTLPKGDQGDPGEPPTFGIGEVTTGQPGTEADVQVSGVGGEYELSFTIPRGAVGATGATGATPNLTIGTVQSGATPAATITGTPESPVLNLTLPKGDKGDRGDGDVSEVRGEKGLTGTVTSSGALKADLKSETTFVNASLNPQEMKTRIYPVSLDSNGKLVVSVPYPDYNAGAGLSMVGTSGYHMQIVTPSGTKEYDESAMQNTISLSNSGATAGTYGPSQDVTGSNGAAINVPEITVDQYGRVTSINNKILTCVDTQGDSLPTGGSTGQVLTKNSGTNGDVKWATPEGLPAYNYDSNKHKVLCAKYTTGPSWEYPGMEVSLEEYLNPNLPGTYHFYASEADSLYYMWAGGLTLHLTTMFNETHTDFDDTNDGTIYRIIDATVDENYTESDYFVYQFTLEKMKLNGKKYRKILKFYQDEDYWMYYGVDVTPTGIVSNTETLTQAEYDALVQAGTVDGQTLYCIKESGS